MLASVVSQDPVPFPHLGLVRDNKQQVTGNGVLQLASKDTGAVLGMGDSVSETKYVPSTLDLCHSKTVVNTGECCERGRYSEGCR